MISRPYLYWVFITVVGIIFAHVIVGMRLYSPNDGFHFLVGRWFEQLFVGWFAIFLTRPTP